jgi:hypothetical protein
MHILEEFDKLPGDVHSWFISETFVELGDFVPGAKPLRQAEHGEEAPEFLDLLFLHLHSPNFVSDDFAFGNNDNILLMCSYL